MMPLFENLAVAHGFVPRNEFASAQLILALAGDDLRRNFSVTRFEEEPITAALAGALSAHAAWVLPLAGLGEKGDRNLCWGHYRKAGSKSNDNLNHPSESYAGADFALLVRFDEHHALLAVFQCKTRVADLPSKLTFRISSDSGERRFKQVADLTAYGAKLLMPLKNPSRPIPGKSSNLDWIHYMVYRENKAPSCVSLPKLQELIAHHRKLAENKATSKKGVSLKTNVPGTIHLDDADLVDFGELIDFSSAKTNKTIPQMDGWLTLKIEEINEVIPHLYSFSDLYVIDKKNGLFPLIELAESDRADVKEFIPNALVSQVLSETFPNVASLPKEVTIAGLAPAISALGTAVENLEIRSSLSTSGSLLGQVSNSLRGAKGSRPVDIGDEDGNGRLKRRATKKEDK